MKTLHHLGPSPEHAQYQALFPAYWKKVKQQEAQAIKQGLPAKGMYDFLYAWFDAWACQSVDKLRDCMSADCGFIDSSTFQNKHAGREEATLPFSDAFFEMLPDSVFYPQDGTNRSLPYADYLDGQWRMAVPWRGIGRWTGPMPLPGTDIVFPPTGTCLNFIGVDRYTLTDDFKITHIDTDWDMVYGVIQLSPIGIPAIRLPYLKAASLAARPLMPALRLLGRISAPEGHRTYDSPLMSAISEPEPASMAASRLHAGA